MLIHFKCCFILHPEGNRYRDGRGCEQSHEQAAVWFEKAARQGNPDAMTNLGFLYQNGEGVPHSYERAAEWWEKASLQGHVNAMINLARLYDNGQGVPQSYARASEYLAKSQGRVGAEGPAPEYKEVPELKLGPESERAAVVKEATSTLGVRPPPTQATVAANSGFYTPPTFKAVPAALQERTSTPDIVLAPALPSSKSRG